MKKYINFSTKFRSVIYVIHPCVFVALLMDCVRRDSEDVINRIVMISSLLTFLLAIDFFLIYMRYNLSVTYYDENKIVNRFFLKKKIIFYNEIEQLVFVGNSIVLLKNKKNFTLMTQKGNILKKYFKNDFMFYFGNDLNLLSNISNKSKCGCYILGNNSHLKTMFERYFNVVEVQLKRDE